MTAEQSGLLATIRETPDDDIPRIVYADWLTENGFVEWAAFIRSSCQLANPDRHDRELPAELERFVDGWVSAETVPDDVFDDAA